MNMNPGLMESMAEYERDRIRRDMKQIRFEKEALRASRAGQKMTQSRSYRPRLLMQYVTTLVQWMFSMIR